MMGSLCQTRSWHLGWAVELGQGLLAGTGESWLWLLLGPLLLLSRVQLSSHLLEKVD